METLNVFSRFSNLQVSNDKTEIFAIGGQKLDQKNFHHEVRTSIKILGIVFDYNTSLRMKANFDSIFKSIKDTLNMWKWRGLTLLGRIQIIKSFVISKILSKAAVIAVTDDFIKEINSLIYSFIWKGNDKIKRAALINDIENGGLRAQYRHQEFQFPLLDAAHCGTESEHQVSNGSLIGLFSLFILSHFTRILNLVPHNNTIRVKETKIWLPFKTWCSLSVPRCAAYHKGN